MISDRGFNENFIGRSKSWKILVRVALIVETLGWERENDIVLQELST